MWIFSLSVFTRWCFVYNYFVVKKIIMGQILESNEIIEILLSTLK